MTSHMESHRAKEAHFSRSSREYESSFILNGLYGLDMVCTLRIVLGVWSSGLKYWNLEHLREVLAGCLEVNWGHDLGSHPS